MNQIAWIIGDKIFYWNSIVLVLAVLCSICMYWGLTVRDQQGQAAALLAVPLSLLLGLVFSRLIHWYCRPQGYGGMLKALTDYSRGGYALIGVFLGCLLAAVLLRMTGISHNLPGMLDQMTVAGSLGICVGRLADLFTRADRGMILPGSVPFPLAISFRNSVSGAQEIRLSVFFIQSVIAGVLFLVFLTFFLRKNRKKPVRDGDTALLLLLWYCGSQAVMDSPRYDSLYFRSNGFVSVVQIFGVLTVLGILVLLSIRFIRVRGKRLLWLPLLLLPLLGGAGYMEYYVQRHGSQALFSYGIMSTCMLLALLLGTALYFCSGEDTAAQAGKAVPGIAGEEASGKKFGFCIGYHGKFTAEK